MKRNSFLTTRGLLALCGSLICAWSCLAEPWPRFRGPNGTGISADKGVPVHWTENNGVLWQAPIPGVGNSSPIVWGQHIFLESASPDGKTRLLVCLNAADGKQVWSRSFPGARARTHEGSDNPRDNADADHGPDQAPERISRNDYRGEQQHACDRRARADGVGDFVPGQYVHGFLDVSLACHVRCLNRPQRGRERSAWSKDYGRRVSGSRSTRRNPRSAG